MADWSQLPNDVLLLIAKRINSRITLSCFRAVCSSWRSSVLPIKPLYLTIPTYDPQIADQFYLSERPTYVIQSIETQGQTYSPEHWIVKIEEDENGINHLVHPLTNSKLRNVAFDMVLNSFNFGVYEWSKEYVIQYAPKDQAAGVSGDNGESMLAIRKLAFMSLSPGCEDFVLLLVDYPGWFVFLFKSTELQWTRFSTNFWGYDVTQFSGKLHAVDRYRTIVTVNPTTSKVSSVGTYGMVIAANKVCLISFYDALVLVAIHYNLSDADLRSENHIVCSKPNGVLVGFKIFVQDEECLKWVSVENLKEVILFLGTSCTFWNVAFDLPGCKGNSIVFSKPRWEAIFVRGQYTCQQKGYDIYEADLQARKIQPLKRVQAIPICSSYLLIHLLSQDIKFGSKCCAL
ncbi:hypothetical protein SO802_027822 [Lithocarpus litseifolius]|uniref:KIB1-4 beta-propeller domain-containing protein n=1 Tax=Lithocarpus litseifolius TaxID=425828 RepID=A0AAW2BQ17_9ROSI